MPRQGWTQTYDRLTRLFDRPSAALSGRGIGQSRRGAGKGLQILAKREEKPRLP